MKKSFQLAVSVALLALVLSGCNGPASYGKKMAKLACEAKELETKLETADDAQREEIRQETMEIIDKMAQLGKEAEDKYKEDPDAAKEMEEAFNEAIKDCE